MRLRDIICNRDLLGKECERIVENLHDGRGCPKGFGIPDAKCGNDCEDCYDENSSIIKTFRKSNNRHDLREANEYYLRRM